MSDNIYCFTYQHTCKTGHPAYLRANAPFKSVKKKLKYGKTFIPFLGEGFYLWEENIAAAQYWGARQYDRKHSIVEFVDCAIPKDDMLDFINRRDLSFFRDLIAPYVKARPNCKSWDLGTWIEFFKDLNTKDNKLFPYFFLRANEEISEKERAKFKIEKDSMKLSSEGYTVDLDPLIMICVIDKDRLIHSGCRILA